MKEISAGRPNRARTKLKVEQECSEEVLVILEEMEEVQGWHTRKSRDGRRAVQQDWVVMCGRNSLSTWDKPLPSLGAHGWIFSSLGHTQTRGVK